MLQPGCSKHAAKFAAHVKLPRLVRGLDERRQLGLFESQLDLDRPGKEDVVKFIVLEDGHPAAGPDGLDHPSQCVDRIRQTVQALGTPDHVEASGRQRQVLDVRLKKLDPSSRHGSAGSPAGQIEKRGRDIESQNLASRPDPAPARARSNRHRRRSRAPVPRGRLAECQSQPSVRRKGPVIIGHHGSVRGQLVLPGLLFHSRQDHNLRIIRQAATAAPRARCGKDGASSARLSAGRSGYVATGMPDGEDVILSSASGIPFP